MTNENIYTLKLDRRTISKIVWACNKVSIDNLEDDKEEAALVWEAIAENIKAQTKAQDEAQTEPEPEPEEEPEQQGEEPETISRETFDSWKNQPILSDEDQWGGKYKTYGEMWTGEGYDIEAKEPTEDQQTTFEIYDDVISRAQTVEEAESLEEIVNANYRNGLLTQAQREALEGACLYMQLQLGAGKKPEDIPHRRK